MKYILLLVLLLATATLAQTPQVVGEKLAPIPVQERAPTYMNWDPQKPPKFSVAEQLKRSPSIDFSLPLQTGFHQTVEEIAGKNRLGEFVIRRQNLYWNSGLFHLQRQVNKLDIRLKLPGGPEWLRWQPIVKYRYGQVGGGLRVTINLNELFKDRK